jgi:hypothetical protein
MPITDNSPSPLTKDDILTVASIAVLAFIVADMAHEGIGHGFAFYFVGGQSSMLTTTRLIEWVKLPDPQWRIFDLGGPAGNLLFALLAWSGQRLVRGRAERLRLFLWLVLAFSLFWAVGYLFFCGVVAQGDWMALIPGTRHEVPARVILALAGLALYRASIQLVASELRWIVPLQRISTKPRLRRLIWTSYIAGGLIACAGPILDPRGPMEILNSGVWSGFGAAVGILFAVNVFLRLPEKHNPVDAPILPGLPWILAAAAGAIYYVGILGPGILLWFGG